MVGEAVNGHEVVERVRMTDLDILLLDLSMPGKSGMELIRQVKGTDDRQRVDLGFAAWTEHLGDHPLAAVLGPSAPAHGNTHRSRGTPAASAAAAEHMIRAAA